MPINRNTVYFQIGDRYFTPKGTEGKMTETSAANIIASIGDSTPGGLRGEALLEHLRGEGGMIAKLSPQEIQGLQSQLETGPGGTVGIKAIGDWRSIGIPNQEIAKLFGYGATNAPDIPTPQFDLAKWLDVGGRERSPNDPLFYTSGSATGAAPTAAQSTQPRTYEQQQATPQTLGIQTSRYYKIGNDVFETGTNRHIELPEFKSLGLNFDHLPEGSPAGVNAPPGADSSVPGGTPAYDLVFNQTMTSMSKKALDSMYSKGYVLNKNVDLNDPTRLAEFLRIAQDEISPFYKNKFTVAREQLLRQQGYSTEQLQDFESNLERQYGQQVRDIAASSAEQGFSQSGIRNQRDLSLAQDVQGRIAQNRSQLAYQAGSRALEFGGQYGASNIPGMSVGSSPRVLAGQGSFERQPQQSSFYQLNPDVLTAIQTGSEQFQERGDIQRRQAELEQASNLRNSLRTL